MKNTWAIRCYVSKDIKIEIDNITAENDKFVFSQ